jgi:iron complex outermembrane receptor protein
MRFLALLLFTLPTSLNTFAQNIFTAYIRDKERKEPLIGTVVNVEGTSIGDAANEKGLVVLKNIPSGKHVVHFKMQGFEEHSEIFNFPLVREDTLVIYLGEDENEMEEVVVSSTRSSRTIKDIPTRVEIIGAEEIQEKVNMKPGDIRMILAESTGIQTLQTSATSGNTTIRIEGLDGRYTQLLKDGFPLYAGFAGGLGLMQTPPLNLKRVEIIKGSSSTLYGGGAIAGMVNLISKTPTTERDLQFLVNGTSAGGLDVNGYYGQRFGKAGVTVYAAYNANAPYTPDSIVFTAIPKFTRYTFNPRFFVYLNEKTELMLGINGVFEKRLGGDINYIKGTKDSINGYFEDNDSKRLNSEFQLTHHFSNLQNLNIKNSVAYFNRLITAPGYTFDGDQVSTFTEVSFAAQKDKHDWAIGLNVFTDKFTETQMSLTPLRNYSLTTIGAFIQNTWDINTHFIVETGLRADYVLDYGWAVLPRVSMLYKHNGNFSSRIGGGLGYKAPTIFTEESERLIYRNVLPVSSDSNSLEHSIGINWDANYKTTIFDGKVSFTINQLFFYTLLQSPLILSQYNNGFYSFRNLQGGHYDALGAETNIKFGYKHFKLFLGYTFINSYLHKEALLAETPLTPKHRTNSVLMYEVERKWKVGIEAYYFSPQFLSDVTRGRDYWLCGFMAEKIWKKFSVYVNFENILDSRQTRFGSIYTGSISRPVFRDIYAPLDGFVLNGGIKLQL